MQVTIVVTQAHTQLGMFITDSLLISNRFRIKCFDSSISIPNFDSLFTIGGHKSVNR